MKLVAWQLFITFKIITRLTVVIFAGKQEPGHSRPILKMKKGGFGNDIVWRIKPTAWRKFKDWANMPLELLRTTFSYIPPGLKASVSKIYGAISIRLLAVAINVNL